MVHPIALRDTVPLSEVDIERLLATRMANTLLPVNCEAWLRQAYLRAQSAATQRLVSDVLDDVKAIGEIDDELTELILGALASVEAALDLERLDV